MRTILILVLLVLAAAANALCGAARPVHRVQAEGGRWDKLMGGSTPAVIQVMVAARSEPLDGRFARLPADADGGGKPPELRFFVVCNGTGWLLALRFPSSFTPAGQHLTIAFCTGASAPPYRLRIRLPGGPQPQRLALQGFPGRVEARTRRSRPAVEDLSTPCPGTAHYPLGRSIGSKTFQTADGVWTTTLFVAWASFHNRDPFRESPPEAWPLRIALHLSDGVLVWGGSTPEQGYGALRWPRVSAEWWHSVVRQSLILGDPAARYADVVQAYRSRWAYSKQARDFADLDASATHFENGNPLHDLLYYERVVEPYLADLQPLVDALTKPDDGSQNVPILALPLEKRKRLIGEAQRMVAIRSALDRLRRDFLRDRLFGRPLPPPPPKKQDGTEAPAEPDHGVDGLLDDEGDDDETLQLDELED